MSAGPLSGWSADGAPPGRLVSGVQLRLATAALTVLAAVVVIAGDSDSRLAPLSVLAGLVVVAGTALGPTTPVPTLGLLLMVAVVVDRAPPLGLVVVVAALLHGVHLLASWSAAVPRAARLQLAALRPTLLRWALAQLLAAPVALGVALTTQDPGAARPLAVLAGVVLVALALLLVRTVRGR